MDAKKLAKDMLSKGKSPTDVRYALVEKGIAFSEADRTVKELAGSKSNENRVKRAKISNKFPLDRKFFLASILIIIFAIGFLAFFYGNILPENNNSNKTGDYFHINQSPSSNPPFIFYVVSKNKIDANGATRISFEISRSEIPENISVDYLYIYTNLDESNIINLNGASYFTSPNPYVHIIDAKGSGDVTFVIEGIYKGVSNLTLEGKPLPFGDYHALISENQNLNQYNIFGWDNG